jgi:Ca2+-binding EF-hand superfamily protein
MSDEQLTREFRRVDEDNDGSITIEELKKYYLPMQEMLGVAPQVAEQEIRGLLKRLDVDNSGTISFEGNVVRSFVQQLVIYFSRCFQNSNSSARKLEEENQNMD